MKAFYQTIPIVASASISFGMGVRKVGQSLNLNSVVESGEFKQYTFHQNFFSKVSSTVEVCGNFVKTIFKKNSYAISSASIAECSFDFFHKFIATNTSIVSLHLLHSSDLSRLFCSAGSTSCPSSLAASSIRAPFFQNDFLMERFRGLRMQPQDLFFAK